MSDLNESLLNSLDAEGEKYQARVQAEEEEILAIQNKQNELNEEDIGAGERPGPPSPKYQSEEMKSQPAKVAQAKEQKQANEAKAQEESPNALEYLQGGGSIAGNPLETIQDATLLGQGIVDTAMDAASALLPWLKPADEAWEEMSGRNQQGEAAKFVRDTAGLVIPAMVTGGATAGLATSTAGKLGFTALTKGAPKIVGTVALDAGIGAAIDSVSDTSEEVGNLSDILNNTLGVQTPWVYVEGDSPDVTKKKNVQEAAALSGVVGALELALSSNRITKQLPRLLTKIFDAKTKKEIVIPKEGIEVTAKTDKARVVAQTDEAQARFEADPEGQKGYDAFVNEPHEPQARAVQDAEADPILFKTDNAAIQSNVGTSNGRARPAVTTHFKKDFLKADDYTAQGKKLDGLAEDLGEVNVETQIGSTKISAIDVDKAVDNLVVAAFNDPVDFAKQFDSLISASNDILGNRVQYLSEDGMKVATKAYQKFFEMADPKRKRASAVLTTQSAGNVADAASAIEILGENFDTTRQQELVFDALKIMLPEIRKNQFISGKVLQLKKLADTSKKSGKGITAEWANEAGEQFRVDLKQKNDQSIEFLNTMVDISKENPEYFKPLMREFTKTNGNVDSIDKLARLAENRLGFIKKFFYDGNPEMSSYVVDLFQQTRYNSVLFGMAPIRAAEGAGKAVLVKPLTTLVGSAMTADMKSFQRALFIYGGIRENIGRAFKVMGDEYRFAVDHPEAAAARGREDLKTGQLGDRETLDELAEVWREKGEFGKLATWNITKYMTGVQNHWIPRAGINIMSGLDGFTKSLGASFSARTDAYNSAFDVTKGAINLDEFNKIQRDLYKKAFNSEGVLTDELAKQLSGEINLNQDLKMVTALEGLMKHAPVAKSIFMFPRTGLNDINYVATFSPTSLLGQGIGKARKLMKASSQFEIQEVLTEFGYKIGDDAANMANFNMLKREYQGRSIAATGMVMGAGLWALDGNLTGSGSYDGAEKKRMREMGWKPYSIRMPNGEWRSYEGMGPMTTFLGLVADVVYEGQRLDSNITEEWMRAITHSISMNVTNKTFLSSFEGLAKALSGEPGELNRWFAMQVDSQLPFAGMRNIASKALVPQLKEVEDNWIAYLMNRNRFLPPVNAMLHDAVDVYNGTPINYTDPMTAAINSILPYFKLNPSIEPWREELLRTGWDGLQKPRRNPINNRELTKDQLHYINTYMGKTYKLGEKVEKLLMRPDKWWQTELKRYAKERGLQSQQDFPIKETRVYELLDEEHNIAFDQAWASLERNRADLVNQGVLQKIVDDKINQGNFKGAKETAGDLRQQILQNPNK